MEPGPGPGGHGTWHIMAHDRSCASPLRPLIALIQKKCYLQRKRETGTGTGSLYGYSTVTGEPTVPFSERAGCVWHGKYHGRRLDRS